MTAIFRETENLSSEPRPRVWLRWGVEPVDVMLGLGLAGLAIGFGLAWLPLGLIVPGALLTVIALWTIFRKPTP